jgi:hypothetical protein
LRYTELFETLDGKYDVMKSVDEEGRRGSFWLVLPFIITSCFIIPMAVSGPNPGEEDSFWLIFLPGVTLCIFPWAKGAALVFQTCSKAGTFHITKEIYESDPELSDLKDKVKKWAFITILTWITVSLSMMVSVRILNAVKPQDKPRPSDQQTLSRDHHESPTEAGRKSMPPAFIENSSVHKRLQFYDNLIYGLIPLPFLGMLAGAAYLIRSLIGIWWKKGRTTPLAWKVVPFAAIGCFVLPIMLTFAIGERMGTATSTEALRFLNGVSDNAVVIIEGKSVDNPSNVISELATLSTGHTIKWPREESIRIQVVDSDYSLILELGRDSWYPTAYWVFYPGYRHTRLNKIGSIRTNIFDDY